MRRRHGFLAVLFALSTASRAGAQTAPPESAAPAAAPTSAATTGAPAAPALDLPPRSRLGFQAALRIGVMAPMLRSTKGRDLSETFGLFLPFTVDLGQKTSQRTFFGVYGGIAPGITQSISGCNELQGVDTGATCHTLSLRIGGEGIYSFEPAEMLNPFVGVGLGWEASRITTSSGYTTGLVGPELHLLGGLDDRASNAVGLRAFVDLALGRYLSYDTSGGPNDSAGTLAFAIHGWAQIGVGGVLDP